MPRISFDKVMKRKKLNKRQFALLIQYPEQSIGRLFKETYNPPFFTLVKYAAALNVKVRDLIEE